MTLKVRLFLLCGILAAGLAIVSSIALRTVDPELQQERRGLAVRGEAA